MIDFALSCGYTIGGLYHYKEGRTGDIDHGYRVLGTFEDLFSQNLTGRNFLLTMGDNELRMSLTERIIAAGGKVPTLVHPKAEVSRYADISPVGVYIFPFTFIQADTKVGHNTVILSHVNVSHTNVIGAGCFIAGGSMIGAYTEIRDSVFIGQGVLSISGKVKCIGSHAYIGAGSLLTKDVPPGSLMVGRPAKQIIH